MIGSETRTTFKWPVNKEGSWGWGGRKMRPRIGFIPSLNIAVEIVVP